MSAALDLMLCALILGVGLGCVAGRGVFRAVIFFITYGLLLAIGWARLGAHDVALAEAAVGAGLTGILLLAAQGRLRRLGVGGEIAQARRAATAQARRAGPNDAQTTRATAGPYQPPQSDTAQADTAQTDRPQTDTPLTERPPTSASPGTPRTSAKAPPGRARQSDAFAPRHLPAALAGAGVAAALGAAWFSLPAPQPPDLTQILPQSGVGNPVTAVLMNFRAWDTLLESIVLLAALLGVWMQARDGDWTAPLGLRYHTRARSVLTSFGRMLPPLGLIFGIYLAWAGAEATGGAFQGGTVLAAAGLMAVMTGALPAPRVTQTGWRAAPVLGPAVFLLAGLAGAGFAGGFLTLPPALAKPAILTIEAALTLSIAVTLALLVLGPPDTPDATPADHPNEMPDKAHDTTDAHKKRHTA